MLLDTFEDALDLIEESKLSGAEAVIEDCTRKMMKELDVDGSGTVEVLFIFLF